MQSSSSRLWSAVRRHKLIKTYKTKGHKNKSRASLIRDTRLFYVSIPYSSLSIFTGSSFVMPLPHVNAVMTAHSMMSTAVITNQITLVSNVIWLIPKNENTIRNSLFDTARCRMIPRTTPTATVGRFVMRVLLMSSPAV